MHILDIVILLMLAAGMVRGFTTGVIRQIASAVGLVLTFFLSVKLMYTVGDLVTASLGVSDRIAPIVGFVIIFLGIQVVLMALIRLVETLVGALNLTVVNRALGGVLGAFKAALLLSVVFLVLRYVGIPEVDTRASSTLYQPVAAVLPGAWDYVSEWVPEMRRLSDDFDNRVEQISF